LAGARSNIAPAAAPAKTLHPALPAVAIARPPEKFLRLPNPAGELRVRGHQSRQRQGHTMEQKSTKTSDFNRVLGDAKKQASGVAGAVSDAAQDVYGQARESAADVVDTASTAAQKTIGSLEQAIRNTIETRPYTAAAIALGLGWLLGRMHRPL